MATPDKRVLQGDTSNPWFTIIQDADGPIDLSAATVVLRITKLTGVTGDPIGTQYDLSTTKSTTITGGVQRTFVSADVDDVGTWSAQWRVTIGMSTVAYPTTGLLLLEVYAGGGGSGTITSAMIQDGTIVNADISPLAAIARSKLDFGSGLVNADIASGAAIALSKLATDPLARANHTGTQTASTISDFDTQVRTSRLDQMADATADLDFGSSVRLVWATDTTLYRNAANELKTDDNFTIASQNLTIAHASGQLLLGTGSDVNLYRAAADQLKTDDSFLAGDVSGSPLFKVDVANKKVFVDGSLATGGSSERFAVYAHASDTGPTLAVHTNGDAWKFGQDGKLAIGSDTNLYRDSANRLKTDDALTVTGNLDALAAVNITGTLTFGGDANLYRSAADLLKTDDSLQVANTLYIGADTNLYRSAANVLKTDDDFLTAGKLLATTWRHTGDTGPYIDLNTFSVAVRQRSPGATPLWVIGISGQTDALVNITDQTETPFLSFWQDGSIKWGSSSDVQLSRGAANRLDLASGDSFRLVSGELQFSTDTNLYRNSANELKTDDNLTIAGQNLSIAHASGQILFGTGSDVNLYRSAANELTTDDALVVGSYLIVGSGGFAQLRGGYGNVDTLDSAPSRLIVGGGGSSPNAGSLAFGDNGGWKLRFGTRVSGAFAIRHTFVDNGDFDAIGTITQNGTAVSLSTHNHTGTYEPLVANKIIWLTPGGGLVAGTGSTDVALPADATSMDYIQVADATDGFIGMDFVVPDNYTTGSFSVKVFFTSTGTSGGNVAMKVNAIVIVPGTTLINAAGTTSTVEAIAASATANQVVERTLSATLPTSGSLAVGSIVRAVLILSRSTDSGTDTNTNQIRVVGVKLGYS